MRRRVGRAEMAVLVLLVLAVAVLTPDPWTLSATAAAALLGVAYTFIVERVLLLLVLAVVFAGLAVLGLPRLSGAPRSPDDRALDRELQRERTVPPAAAGRGAAPCFEPDQVASLGRDRAALIGRRLEPCGAAKTTP